MQKAHQLEAKYFGYILESIQFFGRSNDIITIYFKALGDCRNFGQLHWR